ncbi:MAG: hypothetical protein J0L55_14895, partial [Caulobacterales bacterium]|nr:hypothetical protein [Caulobacterales bacterium]
TDQDKIKKLSLFGSINFENEVSLKLINEFISYIWQGKNETLGMYISEACLPAILTMVHDGTYEKATTSKKQMESLIHHLDKAIDDSANMDW